MVGAEPEASAVLPDVASTPESGLAFPEPQAAMQTEEAEMKSPIGTLTALACMSAKRRGA